MMSPMTLYAHMRKSSLCHAYWQEDQLTTLLLALTFIVPHWMDGWSERPQLQSVSSYWTFPISTVHGYLWFSSKRRVASSVESFDGSCPCYCYSIAYFKSGCACSVHCQRAVYSLSCLGSKSTGQVDFSTR